MRFRISDHAKAECERRQIPLDVLQSVLEQPGQIVPADHRRSAYQSKVQIGDKICLVRVIVDEHEDPAAVITAYRTSKIEKYWSES